MQETKKDKNALSRREMLIGTGKIAAGAAIVSVGVGATGLFANAEASKEPPPTPWGYTKLDPQKIAERAYENWYKHYCCYAVASAIIDPLREKIGGPYKNLPVGLHMGPRRGGRLGNTLRHHDGRWNRYQLCGR